MQWCSRANTGLIGGDCYGAMAQITQGQNFHPSYHGNMADARLFRAGVRALRPFVKLPPHDVAWIDFRRRISQEPVVTWKNSRLVDGGLSFCSMVGTIMGCCPAAPAAAASETTTAAAPAEQTNEVTVDPAKEEVRPRRAVCLHSMPTCPVFASDLTHLMPVHFDAQFGHSSSLFSNRWCYMKHFLFLVQELKALFDTFDVDGTGFMGKEDFKAFYSDANKTEADAGKLDALLAECKDGGATQISFQEFTRLMLNSPQYR